MAKYLFDAIAEHDHAFPHGQPEESVLREWAPDLVDLDEPSVQRAIDFAHRSSDGAKRWKGGGSWASVIRSGHAVRKHLPSLLDRAKEQASRAPPQSSAAGMWGFVQRMGTESGE
jgi:hypothetical protein